MGLAVGDALGAPYEFKMRGTFQAVDMTGGGTFGNPPGTFTDDTSMALCLAASLIACGGFDGADIMGRFLSWLNDGYMSPTGRAFDIGNQTRNALERFRRSGIGKPDLNSKDSGNGSIMRLAPVLLWYYPDPAAMMKYAVESSIITHPSQECRDACVLMSDIMFRILSGVTDKIELLTYTPMKYFGNNSRIRDIARGGYMGRNIDGINSNGYVVNTLEAALWCFWSTVSFKDAIIAAVNLGSDTDTVAAVCGQIAGAYYGEAGIPVNWIRQLAWNDFIQRTAELLIQSDNRKDW